MRSLWLYRRWIWNAALSDFTYRYAGSGLGVLWNVVTPLAMLVVYAVVFTEFAGQRFGSGSATAYVLYLSSGFLPWAAFADCLFRTSNALVAGAPYLKKMPIPEHLFVAQAAVSASFGMFIAIALLGGLALVLGQPASWTWLLLPVVVVLWQSFGFGLGLVLSTLNAFYRDVGQVLVVALQVWMWSIPVVYPEEILPAAYRNALVLNPAYPYLRALREVFLYGRVPEAVEWGALIGWACVAIALGYAILRSCRSDVRDAL
jgi:ABC-type polysaccharide/polyol phosphate export permease